MLDIWPALPISIQGIKDDPSLLMKGADNIIAALEHNDRVCQISLCNLSSWQLENFTAAMHEPFPMLTDLDIRLGDETAPIIPDSFLGGFASCLQHLCLSGIPFPALPKLLLSATDLVDLHLWDIPHSGYISPEAMATCLSVLTRLEALALEFHSPRSHPDLINRPPPLPTHTVMPALTKLFFHGPSEYLEDLVSRIDVPLLAHIDVVFCDQRIFRTTQLVQFLSRTEKLSVFNRANLRVFLLSSGVTFFPESGPPDYLRVALKNSHGERRWQLSSLARFCSSFLSPLSALESLSLEVNTSRSSNWQDDPARWLDLLRHFINVKNLYLDAKAVPHVAPALQELVGERVTEVLPALQNIVLKPQQQKLSRPVQKAIPEAIEQFAAARLLAGHPLAVYVGEEIG